MCKNLVLVWYLYLSMATAQKRRDQMSTLIWACMHVICLLLFFLCALFGKGHAGRSRMRIMALLVRLGMCGCACLNVFCPGCTRACTPIDTRRPYCMLSQQARFGCRRAPTVKLITGLVSNEWRHSMRRHEAVRDRAICSGTPCRFGCLACAPAGA